MRLHTGLSAVKPGEESCPACPRVPSWGGNLLLWIPWKRKTPKGQLFPSRRREEEPWKHLFYLSPWRRRRAAAVFLLKHNQASLVYPWVIDPLLYWVRWVRAGWGVCVHISHSLEFWSTTALAPSSFQSQPWFDQPRVYKQMLNIVSAWRRFCPRMPSCETIAWHRGAESTACCPLLKWLSSRFPLLKVWNRPYAQQIPSLS